MTIQIIKPPIMNTYISGSDIHRFMCSPPGRYSCKELLIGKKTSKANRALLQFDLSSLPLFLTITNSTLQIFISCNEFPCINKSLGVFQILSKWTKKKSHCTKEPLIASAPLDVVTITNQNDAFVSLNITALVQKWYTNQSANLGLMLKMMDESTNNLIGLCSRECENSQAWPYLTVNIMDPVLSDSCCKSLDLTFHVVAKDNQNHTRTLNVLLFNYSYMIVNNSIYPALVHLQVSCDGTHWQTESAIKTVAAGDMISCVPDTITKFSRICYQARNISQHSNLTIHIQGRTY